MQQAKVKAKAKAKSNGHNGAKAKANTSGKVGAKADGTKILGITLLGGGALLPFGLIIVKATTPMLDGREIEFLHTHLVASREGESCSFQLLRAARLR